MAASPCLSFVILKMDMRYVPTSQGACKAYVIPLTVVTAIYYVLTW